MLSLFGYRLSILCAVYFDYTVLYYKLPHSSPEYNLSRIYLIM